MALQRPVQGRAGHDLEPVQHHPLDAVGVVVQERSRRIDVRRFLAGVAENHRVPYADPGGLGVTEHAAGHR